MQNLPDSKLHLESKTESNVSEAQNYIGGGDTAQKKCILGGGDTTHTLLMGGGSNWGGNTALTLLMGGQLGWGHRTTLKDQSRLTAGWLAGSVSDYSIHCCIPEICHRYV